MKFSATTIAMALSFSKFKSARAEGAETSSTSWEGEIGWNEYTDKNCTDPLVPNTNSTAPITKVLSAQALGNSTLCSTTSPAYTMKMKIKCDTTELKGYEDYFLISYIRCLDNECRNCSGTVEFTVEPKTSFPYTPYSCDPFIDINLTTGELIRTRYGQHYTSPEVIAAYMEVYATTCIGDYVKSSSSSSSTPTDTEATTSNENEGMLNDGSGAITGEEGGSSASITCGVSSFVVLAITAGLSTILFE